MLIINSFSELGSTWECTKKLWVQTRYHETYWQMGSVSWHPIVRERVNPVSFWWWCHITSYAGSISPQSLGLLSLPVYRKFDVKVKPICFPFCCCGRWASRDFSPSLHCCGFCVINTQTNHLFSHQYIEKLKCSVTYKNFFLKWQKKGTHTFLSI